MHSSMHNLVLNVNPHHLHQDTFEAQHDPSLVYRSYRYIEHQWHLDFESQTYS